MKQFNESNINQTDLKFLQMQAKLEEMSRKLETENKKVKIKGNQLFLTQLFTIYLLNNFFLNLDWQS